MVGDMGAKPRKAARVRVELDVDLRGIVTIVLDQRAAERLALKVVRRTVSIRELGVAVDWNDVARRGDGGFVIGCESMGKLS